MRFRNLWNGFMKRMVRARLEAWFREIGSSPPVDFIADAERPVGTSDEAGRLRDYVIRCIKQMSLAELEALQLPAGVAARESRS